jgi:hypothetical protein
MFGTVSLLLAGAAAPPLPLQLNNLNTTEGWIWQRVQAGEVADLKDRCGTPPLSVYQSKDPLWRASCGHVDPDLLRILLTQPDLADHAPHGVLIDGARIDGNLNLYDAHVRTEVSLRGSWIAGDAILSDVRLDGFLFLPGTLVEGALYGERTFIGALLTHRRAPFGVLCQDDSAIGQ